jgi:voltage-gated potassium channel
VAGDTSGSRPESALDELFYQTDRVPFVYWREFSGARTTVAMVGVVALLAFITGLSDLSQGHVTLDGPLAPLVPGSGQLLLLYGVFSSFVIGGLTFGLRRRKRVAWYATALVLPLVALLPLVTAEPTDIPLLLMILLTYPLLLWNRAKFDQELDLSSFQLGTLGAFVGVQVYGTVGSYVMRDQFVNLNTFSDAFYYIIVTETTVGYGDISPTGQVTKLFSLSVIILGTATFTLASGSIIVPAIESRISSAFGNMTAAELSLLEDHILVLGHGDITEPLIDELAGNEDVVVVTEDSDAATDLKDRGDINVLTDDPTDKEALLDARIDVAKGVVVATEDDAEDALAILAAKQANPDIRVVASANDKKHLDKLEGVGADEVISPTLIGGQMLGRSVLGNADAFLNPNGDPDDSEDEAGGEET